MAAPHYTNAQLRSRISEILLSAESRGRERMALVLVAESAMTPAAAIDALRASARETSGTKVSSTSEIYDRLNQPRN